MHLIDGPCFVRKVDGLHLDARTYIKHLSQLSESLVVWEPKEKGWRFAQDKRDDCGAVRLWFDSQTSLKLIPWPDPVQNIFPMKKIWKALMDELNHRVIWGATINSLWDTINDNWFTIINQRCLNNTIFSIPDLCSDILLKINQKNSIPP